MDELISVIIPIYKVEAYLKRCVDSVLNQTYKNLEIILVDDGSPDNCPMICDDLAKLDNRIKVLHKENGGLSDARNAGTDISTGSYIIYIDSDDYIEPILIEELYRSLKENEADIAVSGYIRTDSKNNRDKRLDGMTYVGNALDVLYLLFSTYSWTAWGKLFKKDIVNGIRFTKGILYEDFEFIPRVFVKASNSKATIVKKGLYYYFIRDDSIMGTTKQKLKADFAMIAQKNIDMFKNSSIPNEYKQKLIAWLLIQYFRNLVFQYEKKNLINNKDFLLMSKRFMRTNYRDIIKCSKLPNKYKIALSVMALSYKCFGLLFAKDRIDN